MIAYMVLTVTCAAFYSVLAADDFSHANGVGVYNASFFKYFMASLEYAKHEYLTWQGTYFSMFIQALLSPLNNGGLVQLRITMVLNALLFFLAIICLMMLYISKIGKGYNVVKLGMLFIFIYSLINYQAYEEVFYWYSGTTSYSIPLTVLLIAFISIIMADKNWVWYILAIVLGFLAMGGTLMVASLGCYTILVVLIYRCVRDKKINKPLLAVFMFWLLGAVINTVAPGNYIRHSFFDEGLHPVKSLIYSTYMVDGRLHWFTANTNLAILVFVMVAIGFYVERKSQLCISKSYLIASIAYILAPIAAAYPVAMGTSKIDIANRYTFVIDIALLVFIFNMAFVMGNYVSKKTSDIEYKGAFCVITLLLLLTNNYGLSQNMVLAISENLMNDTYSNYYQSCVDFYNVLYGHEGEDVVIPASSIPASIDNFFNFELTDDPTNYVNASVAEFYGMNSIVITY